MKALFDWRVGDLPQSTVPRLSDLAIRVDDPIPIYFMPGDTDGLIVDTGRCYRLVVAEPPAAMVDSLVMALLAGESVAARRIAEEAGRRSEDWRLIADLLGPASGDPRLAERLASRRLPGAFWPRLHLLNAVALHVAAGRNAAALELFGRIETSDGIPDELRLQWAALALRAGDEALARRALADLATPDALMIGATLEVRAGQAALAAATLERLIAVDSSCHEAHFLRALIFHEEGARAAALYALTTAASLAGSRAPAAAARYRAIHEEIRTREVPVASERPAIVVPNRPAIEAGSRQR